MVALSSRSRPELTHSPTLGPSSTTFNISLILQKRLNCLPGGSSCNSLPPGLDDHLTIPHFKLWVAFTSLFPPPVIWTICEAPSLPSSSGAPSEDFSSKCPTHQNWHWKNVTPDGFQHLITCLGAGQHGLLRLAISMHFSDLTMNFRHSKSTQQDKKNAKLKKATTGRKKEHTGQKKNDIGTKFKKNATWDKRTEKHLPVSYLFAFCWPPCAVCVSAVCGV